MCEEDPYNRGAEDDYTTEKARECYVAEERARITAKLKQLAADFRFDASVFSNAVTTTNGAAARAKGLNDAAQAIDDLILGLDDD